MPVQTGVSVTIPAGHISKVAGKHEASSQESQSVSFENHFQTFGLNLVVEGQGERRVGKRERRQRG